MKHRLQQQGNQADKLLPEVYEQLAQVGGVPKDAYTISLNDSDTALLNAGVDITVTAKGLDSEYEAIKVIANDGTEHDLVRATVFNSSAVFNTVISLSGNTLLMLIAYVTSDSAHIQACSLPLTTGIAIHLEIGNSNEIKQANLQALRNTQGHFFTNIDYGYGVGTYQAGTGGIAHVTTARGNEVFYTISADGSVANDESYVKPNEPYSVHLSGDDIGVALDDITALKVQNAGELIIAGSTGMVTYTRAADSTDSAAYFTDNRKDSRLAILTYTVSTKTITASIL